MPHGDSVLGANTALSRRGEISCCKGIAVSSKTTSSHPSVCRSENVPGSCPGAVNVGLQAWRLGKLNVSEKKGILISEHNVI